MHNFNTIHRLPGAVNSRVIALLLALFAASQLLSAQEASDSTLRLRMNYLEKSLKDDQLGTRKWWHGWLAGYGIATLGQGAIAFSGNDKGLSQDMTLGALTTALGFFGQFVTPFQQFHFVDQLDKLPEGNTTEKQLKVDKLEKLLADRAQLESAARGWKAHLLPTSINFASGMVTWIGFHRTLGDGLANFALNCLLTEAQIWSQPIRAKRALRCYKERLSKGGTSEIPCRHIDCNFLISANGAAIRMIF